MTLRSECLTINKREYLSQLKYSSSRIRQDKKIELDMKQEYLGRELYEMIQNADDEGSPKIEIVLTNDNRLHIKNWGDRPFTEDGLLSIMRSFLSTKTDSSYRNAMVKPIGYKGLGFRSLLNWGDEIIIHTNGVRCAFSKDIAKKEWEELKTNGKNGNHLTDDNIKAFEAEYKEKDEIPLPILSIPYVEEDIIDSNESYTTDIEVYCKDFIVIQDIEKKLNTLPCSILLFLRNVKRIEINCKDNKRILERESIETLDNHIQIITILENTTKIRFVVNKFLAVDNSYEVAVAYPLEETSIPNVLYSYFPTKVRMDVPALYHGTFELDASRNHLINSRKNEELLEKLGETAISLAKYLTSNNLLQDKRRWDAFNILNLKASDVDSGFLNSLRDSIKTELNNAPVFPTIKPYVYTNLDTAILIGEKMANWLICAQKNLYIDEMLSNHIASQSDSNVFSHDRCLSDFVLSRIQKQIDDVSSSLEKIGKKEMSIKQRADFIDALLECDGSTKNLNILVDANDQIIVTSDENSAYILSMPGNVILPKCLRISSVNSDLVECLKQKWNCDIRQVTEKLRHITGVIDGDHSAIRKRIESWSSKHIEMEGMKEVLKWEFQNPTQDSTPFSSDLFLLNKQGEKKHACELILDEPHFPSELRSKIDCCWWLYGTLSDWSNYLGSSDDQMTADFLYDVVGVSRRVPQKHLYFGDKTEYLNVVRDEHNKALFANSFFNNFDDARNKSKIYNYAYVPIEEFLSTFTLSNALGLLLSDERARKSIINNSISLYSRTIKSEVVKYSYSAYCLRKYSLFSEIQDLVINSSSFCGNIDYDYLEKTLLFDKISIIDPILVALGAQTRLGNFSLEKLYSLLAQETGPTGIQKRYRDLREAIRSKNAPENVLTNLRKEYLTAVYARNKEQLERYPIDKVYYWDNDQLPKAVLSILPKLEIGSRVGEDSVAQIFGVKLAKNIIITFKDQVENEPLRKSLQEYLLTRIKYFLAYRIGEDVRDENLIRQFVRSLMQLHKNIHIYTSARYCFKENNYEMKNGDFFTNIIEESVHYYICSSHSDSFNSIKDPVICENLNEAICMALKVTSTTMANYFRNIITHDINYIEYIREKDITPETWLLALKSIGLSESEQHFWKSYSDSKDEKLDIGQLAEHVLNARDFILETYPDLVLPKNYTTVEDMKPREKYELLQSMNAQNSSLLGGEGLKEFYLETFNVLRSRYIDKYNALMYHQTTSEISKNEDNAFNLIKQYQEKCQEFCEPFFMEIADQRKGLILSENQLKDLLIQLMIDKFDFNPDEVLDEVSDEVPKSILQEYEDILNEFQLSESNLNTSDALIGKFKGLTELFRKRLETYITTELSMVDESQDDIKIEFAKYHSAPIYLQKEIAQPLMEKHNRGYTSDRVKYRVGKKAELATYKAMKQSNLFEDVQGHSSILNKESGNDNLHYDITYRKKGTPLTELRYLDVKSMSGSSIYMSNLEYEFAKEHKEQYDLAIFHDGIVSIIESPFSSRDGKKPLAVLPDTYQIRIELDD